MKQPYSFKTWHSLISMLFVMMCCLPETVAAQVSFSDDFNYPAGNLHEQGGWVRYGKNAEDPIQVLDKQLTYAGYNDNAPAKRAATSTSLLSSMWRLNRRATFMLCRSCPERRHQR